MSERERENPGTYTRIHAHRIGTECNRTENKTHAHTHTEYIIEIHIVFARVALSRPVSVSPTVFYYIAFKFCSDEMRRDKQNQGKTRRDEAK